MIPDILFGAHIGEHGFEVDDMIREIRENCIARGMNFVTIRTPKRVAVEPSHFLEWARFLAENHVYFIFLYTIQFAPWGKDSQFTADLVKQMREIAGEYFLGDMLGELGSVFCCKMPGYFVKGHAPMPPQGLSDMQEAKDNYVKAVKGYLDIERSLGMDEVGVAVVEATTLSSYNLEAGTTLPIAELMGQDPELTVASVRGAAKAYRASRWGTYFAHEWYAGHHHDDALKRKRLALEYRYAYMNGSGILCHESGDDVLEAYGREYPRTSEISTECYRFINEFGNFMRRDKRPHGTPIVRVAFLQGNLDAWVGTGQSSNCAGSSVWSQFQGREWGYNTPEWGWKVLEEIGKKRRWWEFDSYACHGEDLSALPAYGSYDIVPVNAPLDVLCTYDVLLFAGWNSMTAEQLETLSAYVEQGGVLLAGAAHLNASTKRAGEYRAVCDGDVSRLFGCTLTGERFAFEGGVKFRAESAVAGMIYPSSLNSYCDPLFSGYTEYAKVTLTTGNAVATLENSFHFFDQPGFPALIENKCGKGTAILMTTMDYPGSSAVYPLYRFLVKELLRVSVSHASVRVNGPDALRYTVYEDGTIYLLNTDFDTPITVRVMAKSGITVHEIEPLALLRVQVAL